MVITRIIVSINSTSHLLDPKGHSHHMSGRLDASHHKKYTKQERNYTVEAFEAPTANGLIAVLVTVLLVSVLVTVLLAAVLVSVLLAAVLVSVLLAAVLLVSVLVAVLLVTVLLVAILLVAVLLVAVLLVAVLLAAVLLVAVLLVAVLLIARLHALLHAMLVLLWGLLSATAVQVG